MQQSKYRVLGVMSGTSLDGVDLAFCRFIKAPEWFMELSNWNSRNHCLYWYMEAVFGRFTPLFWWWIAAFQWSIYRLPFGNHCCIHSEKESKLDAVCSHGHTILHQPEKGITLQIGNLPLLAQNWNRLWFVTLGVQDVALGGQERRWYR